MENYKEKIDKLRNYFEENKAERYPLVNTMLAEKDDYTKSLYFRMLCMLVRYNKPNDIQILYIKRLIAGVKTENTFQDYMKMAIEVEPKDIEEFISIFSKDDLRYYFCIDGTILLNMVSNDKDYKLLAELIEILGIKKEELNYLMAVTRSICLQDSEEFNNAKDLSVDSMETLDVYHYIERFYSGEIVNTPTLLHITSCDKSELDLSQYDKFSSQKVIIENIKYFVSGNNLVFRGCAEVIIRNCKFIGDTSNFKFHNIGKVTIENCEFSDFSKRVAYFNNVNEIYCIHSKFINCGYTESSDIRGGIFYIQETKTSSVILKSNTLINSYIARPEYKSNYGCSGIFVHATKPVSNISVIDNYFTGCECRQNGNYTEAYISGCFNNIEESNNTFVGAVLRLFENY